MLMAARISGRTPPSKSPSTHGDAVRWRGELPYTALVDAEGQLVTVTGAVDDPLIVEWLGKTGR
jgi:hypothetical protein